MKKSISLTLLNFAVAIYLLATGILGLSGYRDGEIYRAVSAIFSGGLAGALIAILAVISIAAGAFVLLKFLGVNVPIVEILLIVLAIAWVVFIIMVDVAYPLRHGTNFVDWMRSFGSHLMVLGGITILTRRLGE